MLAGRRRLTSKAIKVRLDRWRPVTNRGGNQFTFRIALEIPVYDFLRHHYVDAVVRKAGKKEVEDQKRHVADTAPYTLVR